MGHTDADFGEVPTEDDALLQDGVIADFDVVGTLNQTFLADQIFGSGLVELLLLVGHLPLKDVQHLARGFLLAKDDFAGLTFADGTHLHKLLLSIKHHLLSSITTHYQSSATHVHSSISHYHSIISHNEMGC